MKCKRKRCKGKIDFSQSKLVPTGDDSSSTAHPCDQCGLLHAGDGKCFTQKGIKDVAAFLEDGKIIPKQVQLN